MCIKGRGSIHSFLNQSAMLFMKDFGICLFFATVGIKAGGTFYETFLKYNGWSWIGYGALITVMPLLIMVIVGRIFFKINYLQLVGLMAGTYTCLLYTSDAADDLLCVDLGGRRIIKKKK